MPNACPDALASHHILVVDDIELNRILTSAVLRHAAYEVDSVADGAAALRAVTRKSYDLVLMDLDMPELAGHAAAAAIRRHGGATPPKMVALSAKGGAVDRELSADIGMDGHIARPISPPDLLRAVHRVLHPPRVARRADPAPETWNRTPYLDLVHHLGHARLEAALVQLLAHCKAMLRVLVDRDAADDAVRHKAHDLVSMAGMLGFEALSRRCLDLLKCADEASRRPVLSSLETVLRRTIAVLTRHVASVQPDIAAA